MAGHCEAGARVEWGGHPQGRVAPCVSEPKCGEEVSLQKGGPVWGVRLLPREGGVS